MTALVEEVRLNRKGVNYQQVVDTCQTLARQTPTEKAGRVEKVDSSNFRMDSINFSPHTVFELNGNWAFIYSKNRVPSPELEYIRRMYPTKIPRLFYVAVEFLLTPLKLLVYAGYKS